MSRFFDNFPQIPYDLNKDGTQITSIDLLRRFAPLQSIMNKAIVYFKYEIHDGERPDIVAHKLYGDSDLFWVILLFNEVHDPYFQWYKSYYDFVAYIENKYGSIRNAEQTVHHYEWIFQQEARQSDGTIIPEKYLVVDETTYLSLIDEERREISMMDYEERINEKNRTIRILDGQYIPRLIAEKARIFS